MLLNKCKSIIYSYLDYRCCICIFIIRLRAKISLIFPTNSKHHNKLTASSHFMDQKEKVHHLSYLPIINITYYLTNEIFFNTGKHWPTDQLKGKWRKYLINRQNRLLHYKSAAFFSQVTITPISKSINKRETHFLVQLDDTNKYYKMFFQF